MSWSDPDSPDSPTLIAAWCELRGDFRHFRIERIRECTVTDERFSPDGEALMARWLAAREAGAEPKSCAPA